MGRLSWDTSIPGSFEADLVHHCGSIAAGDYIYTLQLVDIATGWSERVAVLGRSQSAMVRAFKKIQKRLPFPITHLHPDNGGEFFNDHLIRYFGKNITGLSLSRSRPYRKNDNRFVEQKNSTLVRAYIGYDRLDSGAQYVALDALYDKLWVYYNLFQPVLHMVGKEVIAGKLQRQWDRAQTPYGRLKASGILGPERQTELEAIYLGTNPRQLRRDIYDDVGRLRACPQSSNISHQKSKETALLR
jgi:hypothetical protein